VVRWRTCDSSRLSRWTISHDRPSVSAVAIGAKRWLASSGPIGQSRPTSRRFLKTTEVTTMGRDADTYVVDREQPAVSYGPSRNTLDDEWVLSLSTDEGERIELILGTGPMYELWVEVRGAPWPEPEEYTAEDRLVRQLVHAANDANEEMLRDALAALGVGER